MSTKENCQATFYFFFRNLVELSAVLNAQARIITTILTAEIMIKKGALLIGIVGLTVGSCIEHEVIPPPEPMADLVASFEGNIGGAFIEYTENVNGYTPFPSIAKQTQSGITNAQYQFSMRSQDAIPYIQVAMGSLSWNDPTGTETPSLSLFNSFFTTNDTPVYSDGAYNGFEVTYRDVFGDLWRSSETDLTNTVEIIPGTIVQESDKTGDYSKFTMLFDCTVYHTYVVPDITVVPQTNPPTMRDSIVSFLIEDAIYKGYFKR
ncbi:MAG: hypothetical protein A3D92_23605 [Bacteroidetes bacterium RIFCSPHIGHO2_02_FULL_44_7]|nr:MAG: hypothetical protein A3D92_23605 [Bacteroidetes bacterium RIFCSPHIGHO2_02_FULL_44_7]